jgi:hypothetical protein
MAVGAGRIDRVDAIHPAVEDRGAFVDVFRVGAVRGIEFRRDRELPTPQNAFQPAK